MGAPPPPGMDAPADCAGNDVIGKLNAVFGSPSSPAYQAAKSKVALFTVAATASSAQALIDAYSAASDDLKALLTPGSNWNDYLTGILPLGQVQRIASARAYALNNNIAMRTRKHQAPPNNKVVEIQQGGPGQDTVINSPFPIQP